MGTPIRYTTKFSGRFGGSWRTANAVYAKHASTWKHCRYIYVRKSGSWVGVYSTPDVSVSGGGAATGSGASSSGSASVGASASAGGTNSGNLSYSWSYVSGDGSIGPNNSGISNPTFSRSFSGVPNGTTSSGVSAVWRCTLTDTLTGAQTYADITIGPLAWQNTIPAFTPFDQDFSAGASGSTSVPTGATTLEWFVYAGAGSGGFGDETEPGPTQWTGGTGGGGGKRTGSLNVSGSWGATINYSVGPGAAPSGQNGGNSVLSGLLSVTSEGGQGGSNASGAPGADGANGTGGSGGTLFGLTTGGLGGTGAGVPGSAGENGFIRLRWT